MEEQGKLMPPPYSGPPGQASPQPSPTHYQQPAPPSPSQPYPVQQPPTETYVQAPPVACSTVVVQAAPIITSKNSVNIVCHSCGQQVETRTVRELKSEAYTAALLLCFFGGLLCCWIPFVMDGYYKVNHSCPSCNVALGSVN